MPEFAEAFATAFHLIGRGDPALVEIVALSLEISLTAVAVAAALGLPLGAALGLFRFPGRGAILIGLNASMGLPPVVVGLVVYLLLSRAGPFGVFGLLYTPTAMIVAQSILTLPILAALSAQIVEELAREYGELLESLGAKRGRKIATLLWEARYALVTVALAGFGRASAEVGAVMIVGGNIDHATRVMTTAIALETSKGNLALALGLGFVLLAISIGVNAVAFGARGLARRGSGP